jgi:hypothetical protein
MDMPRETDSGVKYPRETYIVVLEVSLAEIKGLEGLSGERVADEIARGGRFVVYQFAISIIIMTFMRPSKITFVRAGENRITKGLGYTILTLLLGWWGIPWGPIRSIQALITNFQGGKDVTPQIMASAAASTGGI